MTDISMREMLEAGVHFGHQTRYWNPKMAAYLYGHRNKIHIIDLEKTKVMFREALNFAGKLSANKGTILFVGTKRAAQQIIREEAQRCEMPYINLRWLGGLLTNYKTVKKSINRLRELEEMKTDGSMERMNKKEVLHYQRELEKLERNLAGIKDMEGWPDALFVIDVGYEDIAVSEAVKLKIPVIGVVDSNNSPAGVDYVIPGNDDAIRSIRLYTKAIADAIITGRDSVAHLGEAGDKDEFVELDAEGAPVVETRQEKVEVKEKVQVKKKTARKTAPAATEGGEDAEAAAKPEIKPEEKAVEPASAEPAATEGGEDAEAAAKPETKPEEKAVEPASAEPAATEGGEDAEAAAKPETKPEEKAVEPASAEPAVTESAEEAEAAVKPEAQAQSEEPLASDEDKARKAATDKLVELAGQRGMITYKDLSDWIEAETGIRIQFSSTQMYAVLDSISRAENRAGRGMLSALVIRAKQKTPGSGFYELAAELGKDIGATDEEKNKFWEKELNNVYDSHANR